MSTRAVYHFMQGDEAQSVYVHSINSPEDGMRRLVYTLGHAWHLPRFEIDEFAAAFIAANKQGPGNVRVLPSGPWEMISPTDVEYVYVIWQHEKGLQLLVNCWKVNFRRELNAWDMDKLWTLPIKTGATALNAIKDMEGTYLSTYR